jgi:hypothetical protein
VEEIYRLRSCFGMNIVAFHGITAQQLDETAGGLRRSLLNEGSRQEMRSSGEF